MNKLLLLDMPIQPDQPVAWLLWEEGQALDSGDLAVDQLATLCTRYGTVPCYALINGQAVSHHQVVLPKGGRVGLSALPFQLEERLCTDLDSVHFAYSTIRANEPADVLVIGRELMTRCFETLKASGLAVKAMLPDYAFLPENVAVLDQRCTSIRLASVAVGMDTANFPVWWQIAAGEEQSPELSVYAEENWSGDLALPQMPQQYFKNRLAVFGQCFSPWPVNLLSGEFAIKDERQSSLRGLRWPIILLLLAVTLHWAGLGLNVYTSNAEIDRLDAAMDDLYRQSFPGARVVNARAQMRSQLSALQGAEVQQSMLLPWLEVVAEVSRGQQAIQLKQFSYEDDPAVMKLQVKAESFESLDKWLAAIAAKGLSVDRGAFNQESGGIVGQLSLRGEEQ
ncbi:type II secretory pathway, component PulL [Spongiibacter sp. IMCC21906]|uniref:type II secretion system protein GspL n=1 Tax=Spongiibacter sp. IMCC21906 TaxID=1620392 RepID=UPI00062DD874|nr:type II secretion system protein GspL [Spongiibacter sp. IMCC21906]AKH69490.1 type II secretory pathway, component PulL [Spongiibacter sp. IMCC21906]